jgi:hypothetical protein
MGGLTLRRCALALMVASTVAPSCDCSESETVTPPTSATTSATGGAGGEGGSGAQGGGGQGGAGGAGGAGGGMMAQGPGATSFVNSGQTAQSPNYKMVFTFGQGTPNQGQTNSPSYRMQGGLQGANGTLP